MSVFIRLTLALTLGLFMLSLPSCERRPVEPELTLWQDPEPEASGKILYAAKIYSAQLNSQDASWIASHCDLLITDGSSDAWAIEMKATNENLRLFRYVATCLVRQPCDIFLTSVPIHNLLELHNDWFWRTAAGDYVHPPEDPEAYLIDPAAAPDGWSNYWVTEILNIMDGLPYEGVHGDLAAIDINSVQEKCPDIDDRYPTDTDFHTAQEPCLSSFHELLNAQDKLLILNNVTLGSHVDPDYLANIRIHNEDGFNRQAFAMRAKNWGHDPFVDQRSQEKQMDVVDMSSNLRKTVVLGVQPRANAEEILYCIGCYLLVRQDPYVYLNIDWDGSYSNMQELFNSFGSLFETDYGQPQAPRYKENGLWLREYSRGTVVVNLETHTFEFRDNGS